MMAQAAVMAGGRRP